MKTLTPETICPQVRLANYSKVAPNALWGPRSISDFELILIVGGVFSYNRTDGPPLRLGAMAARSRGLVNYPG